MNRTLSAFLLLLRSGLWQQTVDDTALFPLSAQEWGQLYAEARRQTVTGWIYRGICLLPEEWMPTQQLMFRWVADIDRIEQRSRMMNRTLLQLTSLLEEKGFRAV
ncbi:MAG: nucleotidyltransferase family protein, partial [Bacteroidaceae bacterium]|nr:nucleotidyltransferase family protein [Bacteroidaceae bacterium]